MENISNLIVTVAAIIGAISVALFGGLTIWTFRDIRSRSRDVLVQILATVMVGVIPIAGILIYFMLRPRETLAESYVRALEEESLLASIEHQEFCPSCGRRVDQDMVLCPSCHTKLRNGCPNCHRAVHLSWDLCPYCGETLAPEMPVISKPVKRRVAVTQAQPTPSLPPSSTNTIHTATAQNEQTSSGGISNVLDKMGGAIEGLVGRLSPREANVTAVNEYPPAQAATQMNRSVTDAKKPLVNRDEPLE